MYKHTKYTMIRFKQTKDLKTEKLPKRKKLTNLSSVMLKYWKKNKYEGFVIDSLLFATRNKRS